MGKNDAEIVRLQTEIGRLQEEDREKPDPDPSICYVLVRKEVNAGGREYLDIDTVRRMLSGSIGQGHRDEGDNGQFRDACPVVRAIKVKLTVMEIVRTFSNGLRGDGS